MKTSKKLVAQVALLTALASPYLMAAELIVTVDNIKQLEGSLFVSLYNNEQGFGANNNFVKREKVTVDKKSMKINLGNLPVGEYAVKAFHDVNDNGKMDFNGILPAEPYGTSSTSKDMAPPSYRDAKFTLDKDQKIQVSLLN